VLSSGTLNVTGTAVIGSTLAVTGAISGAGYSGGPITGTHGTFSTYVNAGNASPAGLQNGDLAAAQTTSTGELFLGGSVNAGIIDFNINNANAFSLFKTGAVYAAVFGGVYTNASDATLKTNVAPITGALETLMQLKPSSYEWIAGGQADFGFIAQDMQAVLPHITRTDKNGIMGIVYSGVTALNTAAIMELAAAFKAYVAAHP